MDWFIDQLKMGFVIISCLLGLVMFIAMKAVKKDPVGALKMGGLIRQLFKK